jgi:hypothetical protein
MLTMPYAVSHRSTSSAMAGLTLAGPRAVWSALPRRRDRRWLSLLLGSLAGALGTPANPQSMVFTHVATAANTVGALTRMTPQPGAVGANLFVTQDWNPPGSVGVYNDHPVCISLASIGGGPFYWYIENADGTPIPLGAAFTVWKGRTSNADHPSNTFFQHLTTLANTSGGHTTIDHPALNGNSSAAPLFTTYCAGGPTVEVASHYNALIDRWQLSTSDGSPLPVGAGFQVCVGACGLGLTAGVAGHVCTAGLVDQNVCYLDPPLSRAHRLLAVHGGGVYLSHGPIGTWWDGESSSQAVFFQEVSDDVVVGQRFNVRWTTGIVESGFERGDFDCWSAVRP